jgi:hypothetical protein
MLMLALTLIMALQQILMTYLINFNPPNDSTNLWIHNIINRSGCSKYNYNTSFFFRCFQDESIGFAIPALFISLSLTLNGQHLLKKFAYSRMSLKYIAHLGVIILISAIPVAIFLNPLWKQIKSPHLPLIIWITHSLGFISGVVFMIGVSSRILERLNLDEHHHQSYYE